MYGTTLERRRGKQGVLTDAEEEELVQYLLQMQNLGFPLTIGQLREKVGCLTQRRLTPFENGVPGLGWVKCFKNRHKELVVKKAQALEQKRARNLNPQSMAGFYGNLQRLYETHNYPAHHI